MSRKDRVGNHDCSYGITRNQAGVFLRVMHSISFLNYLYHLVFIVPARKQVHPFLTTAHLSRHCVMQSMVDILSPHGLYKSDQYYF